MVYAYVIGPTVGAGHIIPSLERADEVRRALEAQKKFVNPVILLDRRATHWLSRGDWKGRAMPNASLPSEDFRVKEGIGQFYKWLKIVKDRPNVRLDLYRGCSGEGRSLKDLVEDYDGARGFSDNDEHYKTFLREAIKSSFVRLTDENEVEAQTYTNRTEKHSDTAVDTPDVLASQYSWRTFRVSHRRGCGADEAIVIASTLGI